MVQVYDLEHYDLQTVERYLDGLPLYELVRLNGVSERMQRLRIGALERRTELTLAIGAGALTLGKDSKLWHEYQNEFKQFAGGWYETMHRSYFGQDNWFSDQQLDQIIDMFPNITTLHIMVDFCSIQDEGNEALVESQVSLGLLLSHYSDELVTLKFWAGAPFYHRSSDWRHCLLREHFAQFLWEAIRDMTNLRTLWLDLVEVNMDANVIHEPDLFDRPLQQPLEMVLCETGGNILLNLAQLQEFRYTANLIDPFLVLSSRLARIATLQSISVIYPKTFAEWNRNYPPDFARRMREILAFLGQPANGQLVQFFCKFNALTRIEVKLSQAGPRFLDLIRALEHAPNLRILKLESAQSSLFTLEEAVAISWNRPVPLPSLQVLFVRLDTTLDNCSTISFAPLFRDKPAEVPFPLPSLMCFEMVVQQGSCTRCTDQDACIRRAIIQWFLLLPKIVLVTYTNERNHALNGQLQVVRGDLVPPQLHPQELHQ